MAEISRRQLAVLAGSVLAGSAPVDAQQSGQAAGTPLEEAREAQRKVSATLSARPLEYGDEPMFTLVVR